MSRPAPRPFKIGSSGRVAVSSAAAGPQMMIMARSRRSRGRGVSRRRAGWPWSAVRAKGPCHPRLLGLKWRSWRAARSGGLAGRSWSAVRYRRPRYPRLSVHK